MNELRNVKKKRIKPETFFFWAVLIFGVFSTFLTPPLSTGDEGYHLSIAYNQFSSEHPKAMSEQKLRQAELLAIGGITGKTNNVNLHQEIFHKINLKNDGVAFNLQKNWNSFAPVDLMHFPAAVGVLIARLIYPSVGVMDYGGRLANLLFFVIGFYFIIKKSKQGKWILVMLFSVPYLLKIASPSYDLFSFMVFAMFALNFFNLAQIKSVKELQKRKIIYTLLTIMLLFFVKKNYVFSLFAFAGLPIFYQPIIKIWEKLHVIVKMIGCLIALSGIALAVYYINEKILLVHFIKVFFNNYFNFATMGSNARRLWMIVPSSLPDVFNILWILAFCAVAIGEIKQNYSRWTTEISALTYLINWLGIFAGFYITQKTTSSFDELSGRYLAPFIIFFIPFLRNIGEKYNIELSERTVSRIAKISTIAIMTLYLLITFYRGFILKIKPTGVV